jgi:hypothetical protein
LDFPGKVPAHLTHFGLKLVSWCMSRDFMKRLQELFRRNHVDPGTKVNKKYEKNITGYYKMGWFSEFVKCKSGG